MKSKHVEKIVLLLFILPTLLNGQAQSRLQIFTFYNSQGKAYKVQTKRESPKETRFTEVFLAGKKIRVIKKSAIEEKDTVCIRYDYLFAPNPDSAVQDESHFVKKALSRKINEPHFKTYESWLYYYARDTIRRIEIYEPTILTQKRVFTYSPTETSIRYYFVRNTQSELYAEQCTHILSAASVFESCYFRWENAKPYFYEYGPDRLNVRDDSTNYSDTRFHYWNNTFSTKMQQVMTGEGPIYQMEIKKFQDELIASKYKYETRELIEYKLQRNPDSSLAHISIFVNAAPLRTIKVSYKK